MNTDLVSNRVVVVLRHNIELETDLDLAVRELDALLASNGERIATKEHLQSALGSFHSLDRIEYAKRISAIALLYRDVSPE